MASTQNFAYILYGLLEDAKYEQYLTWNGEKKSFVIFDSKVFSQKVLPNHFKHSNFVSFVRQLHLYGFKKLNRSYHRRNSRSDSTDSTADTAVYTPPCTVSEFSHPRFEKGRRDLLSSIKRKTERKTTGPAKKRAKYVRAVDEEDDSDEQDDDDEEEIQQASSVVNLTANPNGEGHGSISVIENQSLQYLIPPTVHPKELLVSPMNDLWPQEDSFNSTHEIASLRQTQTRLQSSLSKLETAVHYSLLEAKHISEKFDQHLTVLKRVCDNLDSLDGRGKMGSASISPLQISSLNGIDIFPALANMDWMSMSQDQQQYLIHAQPSSFASPASLHLNDDEFRDTVDAAVVAAKTCEDILMGRL